MAPFAQSLFPSWPLSPALPVITHPHPKRGSKLKGRHGGMSFSLDPTTYFLWLFEQMWGISLKPVFNPQEDGNNEIM